MIIRSFGITSVLLGTASLVSTSALAQASAEVADSTEILVTARKRAEALVDVPVAITAFTADAIRAAGVPDLQELSRFAPGLSVQNQGAGFGGRLISGIRFRGLNPTVFTPSTQVGSLFVDGVFILGGAQSIGFEDVERVEVIRGPQAAYFGRSTFGGAINFITKDPGEKFGGQINGDYSPSYGNFNLSAAVDVPLAGEMAGLRLSGGVREKGAQYTATDGGELGRERTSTVSAIMVLRPVERLKIKLNASYSEDNDGAPAFTTVSFSRVGNCGPGTPASYFNGALQRVNGALTLPFVCGALPFKGVPISANTTFTTLPPARTPGAPGTATQVISLDVRDVLVNNSFGSSLLADAPPLDRFGLVRKTVRLAGTFDYDLSDELTLSGNLAYNDQRGNSIRDGDNSDTVSVYISSPFIFKDKSAELRLSYDSGPLRAMIGGNWYTQDTRQAFANAVEATFGFLIGPNPLSRPNPISNPSGNDKITTLGLFGSVEYDLTPQLTATFEARYQSDRVSRFSGSELIGLTEEPRIVSNEFLPRAILSWRPIEDMTIYAQYARGTLPGDNTNLAVFRTLTPDQVTEVGTILGDIATEIPAEILDSYEIGIKQQLLGGRLSYALTGYWMDWANQKGTASIFLTSGLGRTVSFRVPGSSQIKGLEFETQYNGRNVRLGATAAFTDSRYVDFPIASNATFFGGTALNGWNARDNIQPRYPRWSATGSATYFNEIGTDWSYFVRGDVIYTGKTYIDELNLTWVDAFTTVNARVGFTYNENVTLELYATNLFNKRGWQTGARGFDLTLRSEVTLPIQQGAAVTPIDRRAVGMRVGYKF